MKEEIKEIVARIYQWVIENPRAARAVIVASVSVLATRLPVLEPYQEPIITVLLTLFIAQDARIATRDTISQPSVENNDVQSDA